MIMLKDVLNVETFHNKVTFIKLQHLKIVCTHTVKHIENQFVLEIEKNNSINTKENSIKIEKENKILKE